MTNIPLRTILVTLLVGTASLTGTPGASPAPPRHASDIQARSASWIAYESTSYKIRLVRPDGSGDHALDNVTFGPEDNPDWSPDGRWLTFVGSGTDEGSAPGLWVVSANGHGIRRVVTCTGACQYLDDPAWSPDGRTIVYSRQSPDETRGGTLEAVNVATGRSRTLLTATPGNFYSGVRFSPDGRAVVLEWVHASPDDYENVTGVTLARIDLSNPDTGLVELTEPGLFPQTADWSPSGEYISYAAQPTPDSQGTDIYVVRPDGTGRIRLTQLPGWGGVHTDFTNDSSGVTFVQFTEAGPELRLVDLATRSISPLGNPAVVGFHPRSRPGAGQAIIP